MRKLKSCVRALRVILVAPAAVLAVNVVGEILASRVTIPISSAGAAFSSTIRIVFSDLLFPLLALAFAIAAFRRALDVTNARIPTGVSNPMRGLLKVASHACAIFFAMLIFAAAYLLFVGIRDWFLGPSFKTLNLTVSAVIVGLPLLAVLSRKVLRRQTWKKLGDPWLKWSGVSGIAVGGFGFVGIGTDEDRTALLRLALSSSQVETSVLVTTYLVLVLIWGLASFGFLLGRAAAESEDSYVPLRFFVPTFALAWLGNLGSYTLFVDGVLLTLSAHLARAAA